MTSTPQSPDLARSGRSAADPKSAKAHADPIPAETGPEGPVPEDSAPGHHPEVEQDRPTGPPPLPKRSASKAAVRAGAKKAAAKKAAKKAGPTKAAAGRAAPKVKAAAKKAPPAMRADVPVTGGPAAELSGEAEPGLDRPAPPVVGAAADVPVTGGPAADLVEAPGSVAPEPEPVAPATPIRSRNGRRPVQTVRFPFAFDRRMLPFAVMFGVVPMTSAVELDAEHLRIRFGAWKLTTPLDNITDVRVTGPYQLLRVAGPPRLSLTDGGITFATSTGPGVCIAFREPVPAALPVSLLRHRAATVTVLEPEAFAETLRRRMTM
jgi:hypothetical protein